MEKLVKVAVDAMGGDHAPGEVVKGAVDAVNEKNNLKVFLVGKAPRIHEELSKYQYKNEQIEVVNAEEEISCDESPVEAIRKKKDSSMVVALKMVKDKTADAFVSAGSSGAILVGGQFVVGRIKGIKRAPLGAVMPTAKGPMLLVDAGANMDAKAEYLLQFAYMGSFYAKKLMGCENPRVGLLNVGTEDTKGGELQHQAFALLKEAHEDGRINFIGNVEGTGVFAGAADVVVTDGFTGNVLLKSTEGVIKYMMKQLKGVFYKNTANKLAAAVLKKDLGIMKKSMDVNEVGGTAMIGISKPVIKAHGSSNAACIFSAMRQAQSFAESGIISDIEANIEYMKLRTEAKAE